MVLPPVDHGCHNFMKHVADGSMANLICKVMASNICTMNIIVLI